MKFFLIFLLFLDELFGSSTSLYYLFTKENQNDYNNIFTITSYSEPLTIDYFYDDYRWLDTPKEQDENYVDAFVKYQFSLKVNKTITIGIVDKTELTSSVSRDFLSAFSAIQVGNIRFDDSLQNTPLKDKNRLYNVSGKAEYYRAKGIFLQKQFMLNTKSSFVYRVTFLEGEEYIDADIAGYLKNNNSKSVDFEINASTHFSYKNYLTNRVSDLDAFSGVGLSHDLAYVYEGDKFVFEGGAKNLFSFMRWKSVPLYSAVATTPGIYMGNDGYNHYKNAVNAKESVSRVLQRLPLHTYAYLQKEYKDYSAAILVNSFNEHINYELILGSQYAELSYSPIYKNIELSLESKYFIFSFSQGVINNSGANSMNVAYALKWNF